MSESKKLIDPTKKYYGWRIEKLLDEGGFGQVFKVYKDDKLTGVRKIAALKAESNDQEGGSAIKLEMSVLMMLHKDGKEMPHVPYMFHAAKRVHFCYMVVTLLGENLRTLKKWKKGSDTLSVETWSRLALQCLYSIKLVHDVGFVHRDIKPANFMMGRDDDVMRGRLVHILDFGLARSYALMRGTTFVGRRARGNVEFRGTLRYCSPNVHFKMEQGRHDDLYSLMYIVVELHCGLPWQTTKEKDVLEKEKLGKTKVLNKWLPAFYLVIAELHPIIPHLEKLNCYSRPDYAMIANCFRSLSSRLKVSFASPYDWEASDEKRKNLGKELLTKRGGPPEYEKNEEFYASDPVGINTAPPLTGTGTSDVACQATSEDNKIQQGVSKLTSIQVDQEEKK
ncbi:unnamed protein product [Bursaphelenchus okinawaensis]|uniref:non-specific serine/threonine protein kinase n=1 Tax=Bursaphelenchus okinawaensis TaxID=465554 RepID=A0A811LMH5_9BILA|nr:unnamed protein product [Bursaphelenchus okinawaensis]CAG9125265.1 unnamed protein product [Bursaphelenchus okinawaensis]